MSYTTCLYHVVFTTKRREPVITDRFRGNLYAYIASIIKESKSKAILVNGVENHLHILLNLHPTVALATLVRDIKAKSSIWIKNNGNFPMFTGWEKEYGAFSLSDSHKDAVYKYILNQPEHHKHLNLDEEFQRLILKNGLVYYKYAENSDGISDAAGG